MKTPHRMTTELAHQISSEYFNGTSKSELEKKYKLSKNYGADRALFMAGHPEHCNPWFMSKYGNGKTATTVADASFDEWFKKTVDFQLELMSRAERTTKLETELKEKDTYISTLEDRLKRQGGELSLTRESLKTLQEQKTRWEAIAKGTIASSGD